jgi:2-polyprenyl-3-methyl-5-hydroxy-6-metoxy-1,4-benzoquinol methylase
MKEAARTRQLWGRGDYVGIAERLEPAASALVEGCAISAGQEVLDVAAGNGTLAVAAAREGATVVASDLTPGMVELGRMRTETEGSTSSGWWRTPRSCRSTTTASTARARSSG